MDERGGTRYSYANNRTNRIWRVIRTSQALIRTSNDGLSDFLGGDYLRFMPCPKCHDMFWVCEEHPGRPYGGMAGCKCGGAGMPCPACNEPEPGERPRLPADFTPRLDADKGPVN